MKFIKILFLGLFLGYSSLWAQRGIQENTSATKSPDSTLVIKDFKELLIGDSVDVRASPINMQEFSDSIVYHKMLKEGGIQGQVLCKVLVGKDGRVIDKVIFKSAHPLLDREVLNKVHILRFKPAIQDGLPVKMWVVIPVTFKLEKGKKEKKKKP